MDEFKSEDELRPDSSDRRPPRQRKGPSVPKVAMSKQHVMIGVGILVLLLLVIAIGSALKAPTQTDANQQNPNVAQKNIDLSGVDGASANNDLKPGQNAANSEVNNPASTGNINGVTPATTNGVTPATTNGVTPGTVNGVNGMQPQTLSIPPVASTPTQAPPVAVPDGQHRIELPGNMADALSQQGDRVNGMTQQMNSDQATSTLPTAPATVVPTAKEPGHKPAAKSTPHKTHKSAEKAPHTTEPSHNDKAASHSSVAAKPATPTRHTMIIPPSHPAAAAAQHMPATSGSIQNAPSSFYTVQISSASQPGTLNAYAKKQQLSQYWVYETRRDGKPWYVLVSGVYPSAAQAKSAVAQLPADIQAKKPWARDIGQVKKDQTK
ncbi:SPOR domain-containing protein [Acerihabitans sp. TG2]|uniref:SPOR domain-containing protein n=1 Tax=Acerihabitans sp. TG2 TaxID=3096008 RepID=UPI002B225061|nr:SPOR domain-containing protein [Acerihabitans sp. TG2]MEA9390892.1 SPOR domain-containing protein [Acerihabitans sp. TG2]